MLLNSNVGKECKSTQRAAVRFNSVTTAVCNSVSTTLHINVEITSEMNGVVGGFVKKYINTK